MKKLKIIKKNGICYIDKCMSKNIVAFTSEQGHPICKEHFDVLYCLIGNELTTIFLEIEGVVFET